MTFFMTRTIAVASVTLALGCTPGGADEDGDGSSGSQGSSGSATTSGDSTSSVGTTTSPEDDSTGAETGMDTSDDGPACQLPEVDEMVAGQLFIYGAGTGFVAAGDSTGLSLAWIEFGFPTVVEACVEWSIAPVDGVSIDPSGTLTVEAEVPAGRTVSVTADLEDGRRIIMTELEVYVPLESAILGGWSETLQLPCDGSDPFMPEPTIPELIFRDTGEFTVTWTPFESYIDYWGTFVYDEGTGALTLSVDGGNYVPDDVDGEGTATVVDGVLTLEDLWLGTAQNPTTPVACGHVFE